MVTRDDTDGLTVDGCDDCYDDQALCAMHHSEWLQGVGDFEEADPS